MSQTPEHEPTSDGSSAAPETEVGESDPNADSVHGLAGEMGVSSERTGTVRGGDEEVTYAAAPTYTEEPEGDAPPEQSPYDGEPEVQPDNDVEPHQRNPEGNPRHGV